jgi:hypothetical protein
MFPWLSPTPPRPDGADRRAQVAAAELASRAGLLYRLGFSEEAATARLIARTRWEYDQPCNDAHQRPAALSDEAIARIVAETYARKPA